MKGGEENLNWAPFGRRGLIWGACLSVCCVVFSVVFVVVLLKTKNKIF